MTYSRSKILSETELRTIIREAVVDASFEKELIALSKDIATGIESEKNEDLGFTFAISTILAIPAVVEGLGALIKLVGVLAKSKKGKKAGEWVMEKGHKIHKWFLTPIRAAIKSVNPGLNDKKVEEVSELIHKAVLFILLIATGIGIVEAIKEAKIGTAAAESVLGAIKGTELGTAVANAGKLHK